MHNIFKQMYSNFGHDFVWSKGLRKVDYNFYYNISLSKGNIVVIPCFFFFIVVAPISLTDSRPAGELQTIVKRYIGCLHFRRVCLLRNMRHARRRSAPSVKRGPRGGSREPGGGVAEGTL